MKLRKVWDSHRIIFRDTFDGVEGAASFIENKSIWIGIFDMTCERNKEIRDYNVKRACINDWKTTFKDNISGWGGCEDQ